MTGYIDGKKIPELTYDQVLRMVRVTVASVHAKPNRRYVTERAGATHLILPERAQAGQVVAATAFGSGGWLIDAGYGHDIWLGGEKVKTITISHGESVDLVCVVDDTEWAVVSTTGAEDFPVYGVRIDTTNHNPETSVEYTDAAVGLTPMRGNDGDFQWGSWQDVFTRMAIRPCVFKDGDVAYYLDPDDFTKKADGTDADITSGDDGDVMIEFPKTYWQFSTAGDYQYVKMSMIPRPGFVCLAHTRGDIELPVIHIGAYHGYTADGKLRSLSGKTVTADLTIDEFRVLAQANGDGYEQFLFYQVLLTQILYVIFFKSLDGQTALGQGYVTADVYAPTGATDQRGMFYGTTSAGVQNKFCGIEDWYGNVLDWVDGIWSTSSTDPPRKLWIATDNFETAPYSGSVDASPRPDNYQEYGSGYAADRDGFVKSIHGTNETGFVTIDGSGSQTTYYCDWALLCAGRVAYFGGYRTYGGYAGPFLLHLLIVPSYSGAGIGGRLTHVEKATGGGT